MDIEKCQSVEKAASAAERVRDDLRVVRLTIANAQDTVRRCTPELARLEAEQKKATAALKELGFHDIGHARGELAKEGQ